MHRNIIKTFVRQLVSSLLKFCCLAVVGGALGADGLGAYTLALLIPTVLTQLLNFGIPSANIYFWGSGKFDLQNIWGASRDLMLLSAVAGCALALITVVPMGRVAFPGVPLEALLIGILIYPFSLLVALFAGLFQAMQDFNKFNMLVLVEPCVTIVFMVAIWISGFASLDTLLLATVAGFLSSFLLGLYLLSRNVQIFSGMGKNWAYVRVALTYGLVANASNFVTYLAYRVDLYLVNIFLGPQATGIYALATRIGEQVWMISQAVSSVALPKLTSLNDYPVQRDALIIDSARITLWATFIACMLLFLPAGPLLEILFEEEFQSVPFVLMCLLPGILALSCSRVLANGLAAQGRVWVNFRMSLLVLILNLSLTILLAPSFGIFGAAFATSAAYSFDLLVRLASFKRNFRGKWSEVIFLTVKDRQYLVELASRILSSK